MLNKLVNHCIYGTGQISNIDGDYITVKFDKNGEKKFIYPDCFDSYMEFEDEKLQEEALKKVQDKKANKNRENLIKIQENLAKIEDRKEKSNRHSKRITVEEKYQDAFKYAKKALIRCGLGRILTEDENLECLNYIKGDEDDSKILRIFAHHIIGHEKNEFGIFSDLAGREKYFSSTKGKKHFIECMANIDPANDAGWMNSFEQLYFENGWNSLIAFCCELSGDFAKKNKDYDSCFSYYSKESEIYGVGTSRLGECYLKGWGTDKSYGKALACYFRSEYHRDYTVESYPLEFSIEDREYFQLATEIYLAVNSEAEAYKNDAVFCYYFSKMLLEGIGTDIDIERAKEYAKCSENLVNNESVSYSEEDLGWEVYKYWDLGALIEKRENILKNLDFSETKKMHMDVFSNLPNVRVYSTHDYSNGLVSFVFNPDGITPHYADWSFETNHCKYRQPGNYEEFMVTDSQREVLNNAYNDFKDIIADAEKGLNGFKTINKDSKVICSYRNTGESITQKPRSLHCGYIYQFIKFPGHPENCTIDEKDLASILPSILKDTSWGELLYESALKQDEYLARSIRWIAGIASDEDLAWLDAQDGVKREKLPKTTWLDEVQ